MSPKAKSILLLVATLVIGLVLGALINGYFVRQRLHRIGDLMTPGGFGGRLEEVIQPSSEEQRDAIRRVLDSAAPKAIEIMRSSRAQMRALNDSVRAELSDILTEEQMGRLEERMRLRGRRGPFRPGVPPMLLDDSTGHRPRRDRRRHPRDGWPPPPPDSLAGELPPPPAPPGG